LLMLEVEALQEEDQEDPLPAHLVGVAQVLL
jgi:hypothetical protein